MSERPAQSHAPVSFSGLGVNGANPGAVASGQSFEVGCTLEIRSAIPVFRLFCAVQDVNGEALVVAPVNHKEAPAAGEPGAHEIQVTFPALWLRPGVYSVHFKLLAATAGAGDARYVSDSLMLSVSGTDDPETLLGYLTPEAVWNVDRRYAASR